MMKVVIESPYAGSGSNIRKYEAEVERNLRFLRACMHDCFLRDEAPFASHGLYTQPGVLDDEDPSERTLGIAAGFVWRDSADKTVVYINLGVSRGMQYGIDDANKKGRPIEYRELPDDWDRPDEYRSTSHWTGTL